MLALRPVGPIDILMAYRHPLLPEELHGKEEMDSSNPQDNRGRQREKNVLSELTGSTVVTNLQQSTHLRSIKLSEFLRLKCIIPRLDSVKWNVSVRWQVLWSRECKT